MRGPLKFHTVGIAQLAEHRIVVPGVVGSSPITHPILWLRAGASAPALASLPILGCSQVVRHGTLTPAFAGSSPAIPATSSGQSPFSSVSGVDENCVFSFFPSLREAEDDSAQFHWAPLPGKLNNDPVAQLVEQRPFKAKVRGSSPRWVTTKNGHFLTKWPFFFAFIVSI